MIVEMNGDARTTIIGGGWTAQRMTESIKELQAQGTAMKKELADPKRGERGTASKGGDLWLTVTGRSREGSRVPKGGPGSPPRRPGPRVVRLDLPGQSERQAFPSRAARVMDLTRATRLNVV